MIKIVMYGYPDWKHKNHHAGFDIVANRILEIVREYYNENYDLFDKEELDDENLTNNKVLHTNEFTKDKVCFWVVGHSMGGGVANLVGAELINGECNGNENNVYCYTFAAPNTFYKIDNNSDNYREPKGVKYRSIFNIINDDDFVPKLPMEDCGWTKYGREAKLSVNSLINKYHLEKLNYINSQLRYNYQLAENIELKNDYKNYIGYKYKTNLNSIKNIIKSFNNMFRDKENMRYDAYQFADGYIDYMDETFEKGLGFYAKAYQKIDILEGEIVVRTSKKNKDSISKSIKIKRQYQMPAFVMQSITNAIHEKVTEYKKDEQGNIEYDDNGNPIIIIREQEPKPIMSENQWTFKNAIFVTREMEKAGWEIIVGEGVFKAIDHPHYLEAYYSLTKEISSGCFE